MKELVMEEDQESKMNQMNQNINQEEVDEKLIEALISKRDELKKSLQQLLDKIDNDREKKS
jgi:hypothetical protein